MLVTMMFVMGTCDVVGEPPAKTTKAERQETYEVIRRTCDAAGASEIICETLVAKAWAESRGRPTLTHTRGKNELGFGLFAHNLTFWRWLIAPDAKPDEFCDPVKSTLAMLHEFQWAFSRGANKIKKLQRVHAGRGARNDDHPFADARFCYMLKNGPRDDQSIVDWEVDCEYRIQAADLGTPITHETFDTVVAAARAVLSTQLPATEMGG